MNGIKLAYSLLIIGAVTAGLSAPSRGDDYAAPPTPQRVPAEQYEQPVIGQPTEPREPVYVWQGNRIPEKGSSSLGNPGLPHANEASGVRYITGGIGDEERDALEAVKNDYNLRVTCSNTNGEFNGDTLVAVIDRKGETVLSVDAGPLFYADLPAGTYTVKASSNGQSEERKVTIEGKRPSFVYFRW